MHPLSTGALASVLAWQYLLAAATAALPGGTRGITRRPGREPIGRPEPDRAGASHRHPGTTGTEVLQVDANDPSANRHPIPAVP
jgi:hypothetical protein